MIEKIICKKCGLMDATDDNKCRNCGSVEHIKCESCGNKRWFYSEISVEAKQLIDLKNGNQDGKVFNVNKDNIDNYFEPIYCKKCDNVVMEASNF